MRNKRHTDPQLWLIGLGVLGGCGRPHVSTQPQQASPLGSGLASYHAPQGAVEHAPAPPTEPIGTLTLRDALAVALMQNPELAAFSWETRAREAQIVQANARPNPTFTVEVENFAGSGDFGGFDASETTASLSQLFELAGIRSSSFVYCCSAASSHSKTRC